jgi:hypothetical protein
MEQRAPAEYILEVFADQTLVKDIVKGRNLLLHSGTTQVMPDEAIQVSFIPSSSIAISPPYDPLCAICPILISSYPILPTHPNLRLSLMHERQL